MYEIISTGLCSPCRGNIISSTRSAHKDGARLRPHYRRKSDCGFGYSFCITCI